MKAAFIWQSKYLFFQLIYYLLKKDYIIYVDLILYCKNFKSKFHQYQHVTLWTSWSTLVHAYIYIYIYVCVCVCAYTYIERDCIFSFKHVWLKRTDTSILLIMSLIYASLDMSNLNFGGNKFRKLLCFPSTFSPDCVYHFIIPSSEDGSSWG